MSIVGASVTLIQLMYNRWMLIQKKQKQDMSTSVHKTEDGDIASRSPVKIKTLTLVVLFSRLLSVIALAVKFHLWKILFKEKKKYFGAMH